MDKIECTKLNALTISQVMARKAMGLLTKTPQLIARNVMGLLTTSPQLMARKVMGLLTRSPQLLKLLEAMNFQLPREEQTMVATLNPLALIELAPPDIGDNEHPKFQCQLQIIDREQNISRSPMNIGMYTCVLIQ